MNKHAMRQLLAAVVVALMATAGLAQENAPVAGGGTAGQTGIAAVAPDKAAEFLKVSDKLLDEAQRQHMVNGRMEASVNGVKELVADLTSNDLLQEGNGQDLERIAGVLAVLGSTHVPSAAKYLKDARDRINDLKPHLDLASGEIKTILSELENLLTAASAFQASDELLGELRVIIQKQEQLQKDTTAWGKGMIADASTADAKKDDLNPRQGQLGKDTQTFGQHLKESRDAEAQGPQFQRLDKALSALTRFSIDKIMGDAALEINDKKAIAAIKLQEESLADLHEIEKLLLDDTLLKDLQDLKDLKEQLENVLKRQKEEREKAEKTPDDKFDQQKDDLANKEHDIKTDSQKIDKDTDRLLSPDTQKLMNDAIENMADAEKDLQHDQKSPAVSEEKKAEAKLGAAIKKVDERIEQDEKELADRDKMKDDPDQQELDKLDNLANRQKQLQDETQQDPDDALGKLEPKEKGLEDELDKLNDKKLKGAKEEMEKAEKDLGKKDKKDALEDEENAQKALKEAADKLKDQMAKKKQAKADQEKTAKTEENKRTFDKEKPAEGKIRADEGNWSPMSDRERDALYQKYARQLPQEYRDLLEKYYEALSQ
jgi:hypothetical protein